MQVTDLGEARRHRTNGEVGRRDLGELGPTQRRGHRRVRFRSDAVGAGDRPVPGVLVEVDKNRGPALLLPPLGGDLAGSPALQLPAERDGGVTYLGEGPARLDPHVNVHAPPARGLGKTHPPQLVEDRLRLHSDVHGVGEIGARLGIQVDAQLVGVVDISTPHWPGVERDGSEIGRPGDRGQLGGA
jgi:hypothetical protein